MPTVSRDGGWRLPYPFDDEAPRLAVAPRVDLVAWRRRLLCAATRARATYRSVAFRVLAPPVTALALVGSLGLRHVYCDRDDLPDLERFVRFEAPTAGVIEDARGVPLVELAREYR